MGTLTTGKIAENYFEKVLEVYSHQMQMLDLVDFFKPGSGAMQNAGNYVWRPVQQHAPSIDGWDLSGLDTDVIEQEYPAVLGEPNNDFFSLRADDLRDQQFWDRRGEQSGKKLATTLNSRLANLVKNTGSLFYRTNATSGYNAIAQAQTILNERQSVMDDMRYVVLNDRDNLKYGSDLAGRQTVQGRPETTWATGQIGQNVANFDVFTGSYLPTLAGGADPATTVTADVSEKPEGGSVDAATGVVTNVDYRLGTIPVAATASYNVGDKVTFGSVQSLGLADKNPTGELMTFTIVTIPDATTVQVYPKPIALDDPALTVAEAAYANIDTQIANLDEMNRINTDANAKINAFWCKNSIEVTGGDAPIQLLSEFGGMRVISSTLENGQVIYLAYDGNIDDLSFKCRLFTWYGLTNANPSANGSFVTF